MSYFNIPKDLIDFKLYIANEKLDRSYVLPSNPSEIKFLQNKFLAWQSKNQSQNNLTYDVHIRINSEDIFYKHFIGTKLDLTETVKNLKSYTAIKCSLRSQTPWAENDQIISKTFHTPMGKPSAPRHLKVYKQPVTFQPFVNETLANQYFINWVRPLDAQGPIKNYVLKMDCATDETRDSNKIESCITSVGLIEKSGCFKIRQSSI